MGDLPANDVRTPLAVLHHDGRILAVDKPAGVPVVPAPDAPPAACLHHRLETQVGCRLWVVHRIDRDTSGVVVFALDAETHRRLSLAFEHRDVAKTYVAWTAGAPHPPAGTVDVPLHPARRGRMRPAAAGEAGLASVTGYAVRRQWVKEHATVALVEARPQTGRHHQIRVHLRSLGTPILFDAVYGQAKLRTELADAPCRRLALHAASVEVPDGSGGRIRLESPLAGDLAAMAGWLEREWRQEPS